MIVYDDQQMNLSSNPQFKKHITEIFTKQRHSNIAAVVTLQTMFGHDLKDITNNATYTLVFYYKRNRQEISYLARQFCPGTCNFLQEAMKETSKLPFQYILLDSTPSMHEKFGVIERQKAIKLMLSGRTQNSS
jgi:hypothetical protein